MGIDRHNKHELRDKLTDCDSPFIQRSEDDISQVLLLHTDERIDILALPANKIMVMLCVFVLKVDGVSRQERQGWKVRTNRKIWRLDDVEWTWLRSCIIT